MDDADQTTLIVGSVFKLIWTIVVSLYRRYSHANIGSFGLFGLQIVGLIKRAHSINTHKVSLLRLDHKI